MMAVYFKIKAQYKRTHEGNIIEQTGGIATRMVLERCLALKKGPAPSRVVKDGSFTFTSTEFQDRALCVRVCEATCVDSNFVRGILLVVHGDSAHLQTFRTLSAEKVSSRRRYHDMCGRLEDLILQRRSQGVPVTDQVSLQMQIELTSEHGRYMELDGKLQCLKAGKAGILTVSSKSHAVSPKSSTAEATTCGTFNTASAKVEIDEDEYFAMVFLTSKYAATEPTDPQGCASPPTDRITKLFEDGLLSRHPTDDSWDEKGSAYFKKTLEYFLHRDIPIQFCLPAFPCKSTNPRKTSGLSPDAAEIEAFYHLNQFCINLQKIYPPGVDFIVVSDGHVFSDCIGTDDGQVYKYTNAVKELSETVYSKLSVSGAKSPIRFVNLRDIFYGPDGELLYSAYKTEWAVADLYRPIATQIDPKDENSRRLMLRSCGFDVGMLEKAIKDDETHSLTKMYRGFSRFMKDDLDAHPDFKDLSAKKRGNLANDVAKEMLKRNQAYSHLVELTHPKAIRISIHQHKNHGPKFAINTLPRERFWAILSLMDIQSNEDGARNTKSEEAHIPTPWHNVLIEVEGHDKTYVGKTGIVLDELENVDSAYACDFRDDGRGARWVLKKRD